MRYSLKFFIFNLLSVIYLSAYASSTLQSIQAYGAVRCGVSEGIPGFSQFTIKDQKWHGFDVDLCKAIAAAIFNDAEKVEYIPLSPKNRFEALVNKKVDVLIRSTTLTLAREAAYPIQQVAINYYDGQGFMVRKASGLHTVKQLEGTKICVTSHTSSESNLREFLRTHQINAEVLSYTTPAATLQAFEEGKCAAYTTEKSVLAGRRLLMKQPDLYTILQETISREPLGPWVRQDDPNWAKLVKWVFLSLLTAEYLGINSQNAEHLAKYSTVSEVRAFLNGADDTDGGFGLTAGWPYRVIKAVGNYAEIFDRNLGAQSIIKLESDLNKLWIHGGLMYAPPF